MSGCAGAHIHTSWLVDTSAQFAETVDLVWKFLRNFNQSLARTRQHKHIYLLAMKTAHSTNQIAATVCAIRRGDDGIFLAAFLFYVEMEFKTKTAYQNTLASLIIHI